MVITRRNFGKLVGAGALGGTLGMTTMGLSCGSVFTDIENYVPIGLAAFQEIISLVAPAEAAVLAPIIAIVKATFADLTSIITQYQNAPAADKATWLGKVKTAVNAVIAELQQFWNDANLPDGGLASTISGVLQIILSTLAAFLPAIGGAVAVSAKKLGKTLPVVAKKRSTKQLKLDINAVFMQYGYTGHQVY
jgi:hypothetical protein